MHSSHHESTIVNFCKFLTNRKVQTKSATFLFCGIMSGVVILAYMSNTDNLYPIDKSTLPSVRFDPSVSCYLRSDSCYLRLDNILQLVQCRAMQKVLTCASVLLVSALARTCCACAWSVRWSDRSIGSIGQSCLRSDNFLPMDIF